MLCLPHAGGSASFFFPMSRDLTPRVEVLSHPSTRAAQDRYQEPCLTSVDDFADQIGAALADLEWADGADGERPRSRCSATASAPASPSSSPGGWRRLAAEPAVLFVSGRRAPSRHRTETVHLRPDSGLLAELRTLDGTDSPLLADPDVVRMILPALRNDYRAAETYQYRPGPSLTTPVCAFMGESDPRVDHDDMRAWQEHTGGGFELFGYPGGHFYLKDPRGADRRDRRPTVGRLIAVRPVGQGGHAAVGEPVPPGPGIVPCAQPSSAAIRAFGQGHGPAARSAPAAPAPAARTPAA